MDEKDRLLLAYLQNGLPLVPSPFEAWAAKLGIDRADLLVRIQRLRREGIFGGIKAVFDSRAFHYQSAWVAFRVGQERQVSEEAVSKDGTSAQKDPQELSLLDALWQHPGVIYGCEREHEFNIWFFIAAPEDHDLEVHVRCLEKIVGAKRALFLPVRKVLKGTDPLTSLDAGMSSVLEASREKRKQASFGVLTPEEIGMIRQLQRPFPLTDEPYQRIASELGITEVQALERMRSLVHKKCLKWIGSFLKPASEFHGTSTLVVWQIPEEKLERIGSDLLAFREISYADRRPSHPEFPYSLYTAIRTKTEAELEVVTRRMQDRIGRWPHRILVTVREFKKEPIDYFPKKLDLWWRSSRHMAETAFN